MIFFFLFFLFKKIELNLLLIILYQLTLQNVYHSYKHYREPDTSRRK